MLQHLPCFHPFFNCNGGLKFAQSRAKQAKCLTRSFEIVMTSGEQWWNRDISVLNLVTRSRAPFSSGKVESVLDRTRPKCLPSVTAWTSTPLNRTDLSCCWLFREKIRYCDFAQLKRRLRLPAQAYATVSIRSRADLDGARSIMSSA